MTREQFDNYAFSIETQVKVNGEWERIKSVNFYRAIIETSHNVYTNQQVEDIKN